MPTYDYYCKDNDKTVSVYHSIDITLTTWGEVCFATQSPIGDTDFLSPVKKIIRPVSIHIPISNTQLKEQAFTKLVKRDEGVYENVTASNGEKRYMIAGDKSSIPHLHKKNSS